VNIAARVMDRANPRQVLVTAEVVESVTDLSFDEAGEFALKGVADPVRLCAARAPEADG
jgi:class 3 adenylate cyclase